MSVRRATRADEPRMRVTAVRAFVDDPVMRWLFPDDDVFLAPGGAVLEGAFRGWVGLGEVWCTDDAVGVAVWIPPGRPEVEPGDGTDGEVLDPALLERFGILGPLLQANTPPEPHWYLQLLATHPDWQRQGIGGALMGSMFERADADGLACYLETETEDNVAYYRHHGFDVRSEWDVPTGPHMWGMLRPAR
jgi:ribosomal protein S18 acetylase RimI-like enzyme